MISVHYAVPKGSYYWVVEATDLAGNAADEVLLESARVSRDLEPQPGAAAARPLGCEGANASSQGLPLRG